MIMFVSDRLKIHVLLSAVIVVMTLTACKQKPAYSDMQLGPGGSNNQNTASQPDSSLNANAGEAETAQGDSNSQTQANAPSEVKWPSFIEQSTGKIKDLPAYPNAFITNAQYGPQKGLDTALVALQTRDAFEKVTAFYDNAIKSNGWTLVSENRDSEYYKVEFIKGQNNRGAVQIQKDSRTGTVSIGLTRLQQPANK